MITKSKRNSSLGHVVKQIQNFIIVKEKKKERSVLAAINATKMDATQKPKNGRFETLKIAKNFGLRYFVFFQKNLL